jgi:hypothetical protein
MATIASPRRFGHAHPHQTFTRLPHVTVCAAEAVAPPVHALLLAQDKAHLCPRHFHITQA